MLVYPVGPYKSMILRFDFLTLLDRSFKGKTSIGGLAPQAKAPWGEPLRPFMSAVPSGDVTTSPHPCRKSRST
ncbi:MAG: hypothetical protein QNJ41_05670 [Xenococcaceae cyanobacterium MO_188.B32]|nr:hypothetical protein [Xenococcaceae cyanobacterium MO_188.B32]